MKKHVWEEGGDSVLIEAWTNGEDMVSLAARTPYSKSSLHRRASDLGLKPRGRWKRPSYHLPRIPEHADPIAKVLFRLMRKHLVTIPQMAKAAGLTEGTIHHWRNMGTGPRLESIEACFNYLGYRLVVRSKEQDIKPGDLRDGV